MGSIRYRSCSIEGTRADAILTFREKVAEAVAAVQVEVAKLDNLTTTRRDEAVLLTAQKDSTLIKEPIRTPTNTLVVRSLPGGQGATYRIAPLVDKMTPITTVDGTVIIQNRGGLRDTVETSMAQWLFQNPDGTQSSASADLTDSSFYSKTPILSGSAPSVSDGGPLGFSRTFGPSTYFSIPTGVAVPGVSQSLMLIPGEMSAWAWVKPDSASERVILSFSSDRPAAVPGFIDSDRYISGTATVVNGSNLVTLTDATGTTRFCRVIFDSQPDRVYEVDSISGLVLTLSENYAGPSASGTGVRIAYSKTLGVVQPPETRNTIYALSVAQQGSNAKVRLYWERGNKILYEAVNTNMQWSPGEYIFAGYQRRFRKLTGTVTRSGATVTGVGTNFVTEFGSGAVVDKYIRFVPTGVDLEGEQFFRIANVASNTSLTLDIPSSVAATIKPITTPTQLTSQRILVHVGKLDGTFNTQVVDHMPGPTGGLEPDPITRVALARFIIGRDAWNPSTNFTGSMNAISMYQQPIDTSDVPADIDKNVRKMFSRSFPDYIASGSKIRRSVLSDIVDGQTVYCDYNYKTGTTAARATANDITAQLDDMLIGLNNPNVKSTSQLAQTIGTPDPAQQDNIDQLNRTMAKFGILVENGQPVLKGTTDISAYNALATMVGSVTEADKLVLGKPRKSFVLIAITEDVKEIATVDACGRPSTTVQITERIVGVNKNLFDAAIRAGFSDTSPLKLKLWWIGSVGNSDASIQKMRLFGMTGAQIADALSVTSSEKMKVFVIPVPDVAKKLRTSGITDEDVDALLTRTTGSAGTSTTDSGTGSSGTSASGEITLISTDPGVGTTATSLQIAMTAPSGLTIDGDPSPLDPALVTGRTVDFEKALKARIDDLFPPEVLNAADADCQALIAIVDDLLNNLTKTLAQANQAIIPFALHAKASVGTQKLAFDKYIPCVANVSASFDLPPFHVKIDLVTSLFKHLLEQASAVTRQAVAVVERFNTLLCIPRTLIAALRGGVCGIEQPKVLANRQCPSQLDLLLDRLQALVDTIDLLLRRVLVALTTFTADVELSGGSASKLAIDASLPCIGPVANFLLVLG